MRRCQQKTCKPIKEEAMHLCYQSSLHNVPSYLLKSPFVCVVASVFEATIAVGPMTIHVLNVIFTQQL